MRILVTPQTGFTVRDPKTMQPLPAAGAVKEDGQYWRRREREGSVTIAPAPAEPATDKAKAKA